eukprot:2786639-Karenia_brevis.AAC.1
MGGQRGIPEAQSFLCWAPRFCIKTSMPRQPRPYLDTTFEKLIEPGMGGLSWDSRRSPGLSWGSPAACLGFPGPPTALGSPGAFLGPLGSPGLSWA